MFRKLIYALIIITLMIAMPAYFQSPDEVKAIGAQSVSGEHLVPPRDEVVVQGMMADGTLPLNASHEQIQSALQKYHTEFAKKTDTWINPKAQEMALKYEAVKARTGRSRIGLNTKGLTPFNNNVTKVSVKIFTLAVDFSDTPQPVTFEYVNDAGDCVQTTDTFAGPLQGQIPAPVPPNPSNPAAPYDNNTVWYTPQQTADVNFYANLIFGYKGPGRVRMDLTDPRDGKPGINFKGVTVQDYYDHMAGKGNVKLSGVVEGWETADHPEAYYGADTCSGNHSGGAFDQNGNRVSDPQLIVDAVAKFNASHPNYDWSQFDANHDGVLDTFWLIHAGMGQEGGGGQQADFSIWSHSSDTRNYAGFPHGVLVHQGATEAENIYIGPYTMQPENADIGVFSEEFGHNVFGLPDLYATDGQGSIGFWAIMEGGAWGGYLGGEQPVGMPLWFKMIADCGGVSCNWDQPMYVRNYNDPDGYSVVRPLEYNTPWEISGDKGVRINLPDIVESVPNPVPGGSGNAAYTGAGRDGINITLSHPLSVPTGGAHLLTIPSYWDIEEDWDYGYVEVSTDGGATWAMLPDMGGVMRATNPNGNNEGVGLTGAGEGDLNFNLTAYAGQQVLLRLRYKTDAATTYTGWFVDNISLDGALVSNFDDVAPISSWTNSNPGWMTVPMTNTYRQYYLAEWRTNTKYDGMTRTAYVTTDYTYGPNGEDLWHVERVPYNIPAALVYYRNSKYTNTYAQRPNYYDPPSFGPKYQLLLVDMHEMPIRLFDGAHTAANYLAYLNSRASSYDAGLTTQKVEGFKLSKVNGLPAPVNGPYVIDPQKNVKVFDDRIGRYPGFYYDPPCAAGRLCYANRDGSAVIPAKDLYSTRITDFYGNPLTDLYGIDFPPSWLGSGNPGDDGVQYGVMIELQKRWYNDSVILRLYNSSKK